MNGEVPTELKLLGVAVIIGLVQIVLSAQTANQQRGIAWGVGPRDEPRPLTGVPGRLQRALGNFTETFPLFAAAVIAAYVTGKLGTQTLWGSALYVAGRVLFVPLYAAGTPGLRTAAWAVSFIGIVMVTTAIFL
jgi:uncharacterized MAPEG superfamily protein